MATEVRCKNCDKMLGVFELVIGAIKCPRCYKIFEYKLYSNIVMTNTYDPKDTKEKLKNI